MTEREVECGHSLEGRHCRHFRLGVDRLHRAYSHTKRSAYGEYARRGEESNG